MFGLYDDKYNICWQYKGVIFGKGESWKVMRRFTLSTLRDFGMGKKTIEDRIIEESQRLMEVFQSHKGKPFDPQIIINSAVSNIICSIVFGDRFDYGDTQFLNLQRIVNESVRLIVSPRTQPENLQKLWLREFYQVFRYDILA
ncbi:UNVERIFIED_CONTAM: hypothetical protein FKN15_054489 [Acipenser sinensis]